MKSLSSHIARRRDLGQSIPQPLVGGKLSRVVGLTLEAVGLSASVGDRCEIKVDELRSFEAEVVGFEGDKTYLMPLEHVPSVRPGAMVSPLQQSDTMPVGKGLLGRVLDGSGDPLDHKGMLSDVSFIPQHSDYLNPMKRPPIRDPLDVGVRAINSLLTVGVGQRLGLFAGSGVGKSMLLGMMTRFTSADVVVVGLIGERGREVKEFIEDILGEEGLQRAVVVAAPADDSPLKRMRAARLATRIAEDFRDAGHNVLLLMDSLTRYAQAQREIALSIGEPPATRGYPPSVFAKLPQLVERAGTGRPGTGSITAFYTVLTEGDDQQDPIADAARAILDGHIVLSRALADSGHYPAIDVESSVSRVMPNIVSAEHLSQAQRFKLLYSRYQQTRDLISVGAYVRGSDETTDFAIDRIDMMNFFLKQSLKEGSRIADDAKALGLVVTPPKQAEPAQDES